MPIYRVGATGTLLWYAMKLVKGRSLAEIIRQQGPLPLEEVVAIVEQAGSGLQYAHRNGVVHRDIKPANVMVEENGWVLVCDFGVARAFGNSQTTEAGSVVGTPHYMSPEQFDSRPVDGRSDQYSLAVMTYEALTGAVPFTGESLGELVRLHLLEPPPRVTDLRGGLPATVADALQRGMSKLPEDRFQDVSQLVQALGGSAEPRSPVRSSTPRRTPASGSAKAAHEAPRRAPLGIISVADPEPEHRWSRGPKWLAVPTLLVLIAASWALFGRPTRVALPAWVPTDTASPPAPTRAAVDSPQRSPVPPAPSATQSPPTADTTPATRPRSAVSPPPPPVRRNPGRPSRAAVLTRPPSRAAPQPITGAATDSGTVIINSMPVARVFVDGNLVGVTPIPALRLSVGVPHTLRIEREGFVSQQRVIRLPSRDTPLRVTDIVLAPVSQ